MNQNRVLIIEDDSFLSDLYKSELEALGLEVIQAFDGLEGLSKISQNQPNLIILDIVLPSYSGLEVMQKMKTLPEAEKIPVVLLTNVRDQKTVDKCLALGAKSYFLKATTTPSSVAQEVKRLLTAEPLANSLSTDQTGN